MSGGRTLPGLWSPDEPLVATLARGQLQTFDQAAADLAEEFGCTKEEADEALLDLYQDGFIELADVAPVEPSA